MSTVLLLPPMLTKGGTFANINCELVTEAAARGSPETVDARSTHVKGCSTACKAYKRTCKRDSSHVQSDKCLQGQLSCSFCKMQCSDVAVSRFSGSTLDWTLCGEISLPCWCQVHIGLVIARLQPASWRCACCLGTQDRSHKTRVSALLSTWWL